MKRISVLLAVCAVIASATFISCASSKKAETTPETITTDWLEAELTDLQDCGYFYTSPELGQVDMIEGEFKKATGYVKSAYGFVFGYTTPADNGKLGNYIRFEINPDGEYALYKWDGTNYTDLVEANDKATAYFYQSGSINKGYDATNKLKIELNSSNKYDCFINGTKVASNIARINDGKIHLPTAAEIKDNTPAK